MNVYAALQGMRNEVQVSLPQICLLNFQPKATVTFTGLKMQKKERPVTAHHLILYIFTIREGGNPRFIYMPCLCSEI
jgi:hypothetical protein